MIIPQPIETADRSGDWIILWAEGIKPCPFYWSEARGMWVQDERGVGAQWDTYPDGSCGPTHWMPMPSYAVFEATVQTELERKLQALRVDAPVASKAEAV